MSGDLSVGTEMPSFVNPGDKFDFVSSGVTIPESETDKTVERVYTYKDSEKNVKDTIDKYSVVIPDIVGEYKVTATAEAKGYYTKTKVLTTTVTQLPAGAMGSTLPVMGLPSTVTAATPF